MRQEFRHSNQWRDGDDDFGLLGPSSTPGSQQGKSIRPSRRETDNTNFSPMEDEKHAPNLPRTHLDLNNLSNAWKQQDSRIYQILLLVEPEKVQTLTRVQWHESQRCTIRPDGYAILEFRVQCLGAMKHWLKHHAPCIQIIRTVSPQGHFF
ncbi:MAG: WYL domain-containing protein [Planctomycetes bacterium]|nr:WYL domain-containing protein [Planctomycetota bacterium]